MAYFLGVDVGGTKTHLMLADEHGRVVGFVVSGPGNPDSVGYEGLSSAIAEGYQQLVAQTDVPAAAIAGVGLGVAGYDWPEDEPRIRDAIRPLNLQAPISLVNDTVLGILAGTEDGWGVAVVSGTGCNAWGWDRERRRIGRVTGGGLLMGEGAGASELLVRSLQAVAHSWTMRGPSTMVADLFVQHVGARDLEDFLAGIMRHRYRMDRDMVLLVFQAAHNGDPVAVDLVRWAGRELGELVNAVIRQIGIQDMTFDVVLVGSMFNGSPLLREELESTVHVFAPGARMKRLTVPPVVGAVMLGMEAAGVEVTAAIRRMLEESTAKSVPDTD